MRAAKLASGAGVNQLRMLYTDLATLTGAGDPVASHRAGNARNEEDHQQQATCRNPDSEWQAHGQPFPAKTHIGNTCCRPNTMMLKYGTIRNGRKEPVTTPSFASHSSQDRRRRPGLLRLSRVGAELPRGWARDVYSRSIIPTEIVEDRLSVYERTEKCGTVSSGMAAIAHHMRVTSACDVILHYQPLYGGTENLICETLAGLSLGAVGFADGIEEAGSQAGGGARRAQRQGCDDFHRNTRLNPTKVVLVDIAMVRESTR